MICLSPTPYSKPGRTGMTPEGHSWRSLAEMVTSFPTKICMVKSLPVRCRFRFSPPDRASRASRRFATIKLPFPLRPRPSLAFYPLLYFVTALCHPP